MRALRHLLLLSFFLSVSSLEIGFGLTRCTCDGSETHSWSLESILHCQKVSDFLIATAYFSIPLELLYFATCSNLFPFKWIVLQFGAFIVLCGLTHLLTVFTYEPHSFLLVLALTTAKFLTALVSFATTITLLTLIPQLLRIKVRENYLRIKARDLDREVVLMKRQEEASWHVRMLTHEIRKSLDRHTILYTTMVELSKTLNLQNCAVWMPNDSTKEMILTHQLKEINLHSSSQNPNPYISIPSEDPDIKEIKNTNGVRILRQDSLLGSLSSGSLNGSDPNGSFSNGSGPTRYGPVAAIRMPLLKASDFKGGTPETVQAKYAILVLVLSSENLRDWTDQELEIVSVVADQVAVALSHASVLEESQLMREKLAEQYRVLLQAKREALRASEARNSFQIAMSHGMRKPMHSVIGLLSMLQQENNLKSEQKLVINAIYKTSGVVLNLINDVMESSSLNRDRVSLIMRPFELTGMVKEAVSVTRCLCQRRNIRFSFQVESNLLPDKVIGDEKRVFHVILHMVGSLLSNLNGSGWEDNGSGLEFLVNGFDGREERRCQEWVPWKLNSCEGYACVKFEIKRLMVRGGPGAGRGGRGRAGGRFGSEAGEGSLGSELGLSFTMCKKLVQMMNGNIQSASSSDGSSQTLTLVLQFQLQTLPSILSNSSLPGSVQSNSTSPDFQPNPNFTGLRVLVADEDFTNRIVTVKLLNRLNCRVSSVSSSIQCLNQLGTTSTPYQLLLLDLNMGKLDGFEIATRIRNFRSGCWPLIVGLTAGGGNEDGILEKCVQAGINGLIRKPITLAGLGEELQRVLQNT
ncbi:hypothetical protein LUZ60_016213 [Juncus effusus]|nr:hypothetical protein LUZ60_016213 [Juncus effusus]